MDHVLDRHSAETQVRNKAKILEEVCEDIFSKSPLILRELLAGLLEKYSESASANEISLEDGGGEEKSPNDWNLSSLAEDVASVAQAALEENGFVYDPTTGLYYDHKSQCHYNPELKLYYYHQTGSYYFYDEESRGLKFYCTAGSGTDGPQMPPVASQMPPAALQLSPSASQMPPAALQLSPSASQMPPAASQLSTSASQMSIAASQMPPAETPFPESNSSEETTARNSSPTSLKIKRTAEGWLAGAEKEEGECTDSEEEPPPPPVVIEAPPKTFEPDHAKHIAPCIRVVVKSSLLEELRPGTLFIVTCTGGTLGREGNHDILIPDQLVSKLHSSFRYVYKDGSYFFEIVDEGSKNGTYLNGSRLSDSLRESAPAQVSHGSTLTVGGTDLLCHIHPKDETCLDCVGYHLPYREKKQAFGVELSLKAKYNHELSQIRKKFGLVNWSEGTPGVGEGYEDRAAARRKKVGSSHSAEKTQAASIHLPIDKQNKGFALMTKMGWVEGTGIGKNNGNVEPIVPEGNEGKLGLGCEKVTFTSQKTDRDKKKANIAKKTLERFQKLQD